MMSQSLAVADLSFEPLEDQPQEAKEEADSLYSDLSLAVKEESQQVVVVTLEHTVVLETGHIHMAVPHTVVAQTAVAQTAVAQTAVTQTAVTQTAAVQVVVLHRAEHCGVLP